MSLSDGYDNDPFFLGMGFAGVTNPIRQSANDSELILPDNVERPEPPKKRELGFHAIEVRQGPKNNQRQHFGIRAQSDQSRPKSDA